MRVIKGDIISELESGRYDAVAHGCNCMGVMGAGVAKVLNEYTGGELLRVDMQTDLGDINKLGQFSVLRDAPIPIYNLYTQFAPIQKGQKVVVHWDSVVGALEGAILDVLDPHAIECKILIPMIGCGLAGGSYSDLVRSIDYLETLVKPVCDVEITVVKL